MPDDDKNSESSSVEVKAEGAKDKTAEEDKPKFKFIEIIMENDYVKSYKWKYNSNTQFKEFVC